LLSVLTTAVCFSVGCRSGTGSDGAVGLDLTPSELNMIVGTSVPIMVAVVRADGTNEIVPPRSATFRSSNEAVARMSPDSAGLVLAVGQGAADIGVTVTVDGKRLAKTLHVTVGFVIPAGK
jgi:hypothetical protein